MPYQCRKCGTQVERMRKVCPGCERRMLKGDWVRVDKPSSPKKKCTCQPCKGTGWITVTSIDGMEITRKRCSKCNGKGWFWC